MQKNGNCPPFLRGCGHKFWKIMRVFLVLMIGFTFSLSASSFAQQERVSLDMKNVTVKMLFDEIQRQTDLHFLFNTEQTNQLGKLSIKVESETVENVLKRIFEGTDLVYNFRGNIIVVKREVKVVDDEQKKSIRIVGRVTDEKKLPLPGVTVLVKGLTLGTVTNVEGRYVLNLPAMEKFTLLFSFVGMENREVAYTGKDTINVVMKESEVTLDEVVVVSTGYQTIDKRKLTSAVTSIKAEDIIVPGLNSIDQMLEGHVPGMIFMQNSGQVGAVPRLRIRGTSTILGNQEPVWVVDGIIQQDPVDIDPSQLNDLDFVNLLGNAISGLNPEDIEQIDVLKDASATAIYGARAANGVIVITTKKGKEGPPTINYSVAGTFTRRPHYGDKSVNMMNSKERIALSRELVEKGIVYNTVDSWVGYEGALRDYWNDRIDFNQFQKEVGRYESMNTDWLDLLLQNSWSHRHTLGISGGSSSLKYYASLGYNDSQGTTKGEGMKNYTTSVNLTANLNNVTLRFGMNGNVSDRSYTPSEVNVLGYAYNTSRALPAFNEDGSLWFYKRRGYSNDWCPYSIINEMNNSSYDVDSKSMSVNATVDWRMIEPLKLGLTFSYSTSSTDVDTWYGQESFYVRKLRQTDSLLKDPDKDEDQVNECPVGGELKKENSDSESWILRAQLDFNKYLDTERNHQIVATVGAEASSSHYTSARKTYRGYTPDRGLLVAEIDLAYYQAFRRWSQTSEARGVFSDSKTNLVSGYASLSYDYKGLYMFNANMRFDTSNKFGTKANDKITPIWSVSGRWNIKNDLFEDVNWLGSLSLRASFGYQGNMLESESSKLVIRKGDMNSTLGEYASFVETFPNPSLKWEKTASTNVQLDFDLFKGRLSASVSYYYKKTNDTFLTKTISRVNGREDYVLNKGTLENKGFEFSLRVIPVNTLSAENPNGFRWIFDPQLGQVLNQLTKGRKVKDKSMHDRYTYEDYLNGSAQIVGRPLNTFYSYKFKGLDPTDGCPMFYDVDQYDYDEEGNVVLDRGALYDSMDRDDVFTTVLEHSGTRVPVIQGGLTNSFTYRRFTLSFNLAYSLGSKVRLLKMYPDLETTYGTIAPQPTANARKEFINRWRYPGDERKTTIPGIVSGARFGQTMGMWCVEKPYNFGKNLWNMWDNSNIRVVSGDYLKLQSLSLRYNVPEAFAKKMYMKSAYIGFSCTNLFMICDKKLKGQDPAVQSGSAPSINMSLCPTFSMNLNVTF